MNSDVIAILSQHLERRKMTVNLSKKEEKKNQMKMKRFEIYKLEMVKHTISHHRSPQTHLHRINIAMECFERWKRAMKPIQYYPG